MDKITAEDVRELRKKTGASLMDCRRALEKSEGISEIALWYAQNCPHNKVLGDNELKEFYKNLEAEKDEYK